MEFKGPSTHVLFTPYLSSRLGARRDITLLSWPWQFVRRNLSIESLGSQHLALLCNAVNDCKATRPMCRAAFVSAGRAEVGLAGNLISSPSPTNGDKATKLATQSLPAI